MIRSAQRLMCRRDKGGEMHASGRKVCLDEKQEIEIVVLVIGARGFDLIGHGLRFLLLRGGWFREHNS